ncbi:MAG: hypothetical protein SPD93_00065 [Lachnospiraceae bacterium]|nr:hypothetical protein [Lachnospiraceae bacterium]
MEKEAGKVTAHDVNRSVKETGKDRTKGRLWEKYIMLWEKALQEKIQFLKNC